MRQAQRAEVVQLHGALEIVEAVEARFDAAPDRASGVVDQHVDPAVIGDQQFHEAVAFGHVGHVGRIGDDVQPGVLEFFLGLRQLVFVAPANEVMAPASASLWAAARPMPDEPPVTSTTLPATLPVQRAVDEQGRVEVALPVIPDRAAYSSRCGHYDAAALQRRRRIAVVEAGRVVDEIQDVIRQAEVFHDRVFHAPHRGQRQHALLDRFRDEAEQGGIDAQAHGRRVRGAGEGIEHVADAHRLPDRSDGSNCVAQFFLVRDVVHRIDHVVDRHDIDAPAFDADGRHPRRQHLAHALDQLEEIIRAVDLVHFPGLGIADHHAGAVDAKRHLGFFAHDLLGFVLGAKYG